VAINEFARVERVVFGLVAAKIMRRERGVRFFTRLIEAPIKTVQIEMDVSSMRRDAAHVELGVAAPDIANVLALRIAHPDPRVVERGVEVERVEFLDGRTGEERKPQFRR